MNRTTPMVREACHARICISQQDLQVHCIWVPPTTQGFLAQPRAQITWHTYVALIFHPFTEVERMRCHQVANTDKPFAPIFPNISKIIVDTATFHDTIPTKNSDEVRRELLGFLPAREDAEHLCSLYLEYGRHTYVLRCRQTSISHGVTAYLDGTASRGRNFTGNCWIVYTTSKPSTPHWAYNF